MVASNDPPQSPAAGQDVEAEAHRLFLLALAACPQELFMLEEMERKTLRLNQETRRLAWLVAKHLAPPASAGGS